MYSELHASVVMLLATVQVFFNARARLPLLDKQPSPRGGLSQGRMMKNELHSHHNRYQKISFTSTKPDVLSLSNIIGQVSTGQPNIDPPLLVEPHRTWPPSLLITSKVCLRHFISCRLPCQSYSYIYTFLSKGTLLASSEPFSLLPHALGTPYLQRIYFVF